MRRLGVFVMLMTLLGFPFMAADAAVTSSAIQFGSCKAVTVRVDYTRETDQAESVTVQAAVGGTPISPLVTWTIPAGEAGATYSRTVTTVFDTVQADSTVIQAQVAETTVDTYPCTGTGTVSFQAAVQGVVDNFAALGLAPLFALGGIVSLVGYLALRVMRAVR